MRARVEQSSERQNRVRWVWIGASLVSGPFESRARVAAVQSRAIDRQPMNVVAINHDCRNTHRSVETRNHFECARVCCAAGSVAEHETHTVDAVREACWNRDRLARVRTAWIEYGDAYCRSRPFKSHCCGRRETRYLQLQR